MISLFYRRCVRGLFFGDFFVFVRRNEKIYAHAEKLRQFEKNGNVRYRFPAFPFGNGFIRIVDFFRKFYLRELHLLAEHY